MKHFARERKTFVTVATLVVFVVLVSSLAADAQLSSPPQQTFVFSPPQTISNTPGISTSHQIAVDPKGDIYVVWLDNSPGYNAVFFSRGSTVDSLSSPDDIE